MSKFIIKIGLFAIGLVVINLLLYRFVFRKMLYESYIVKEEAIRKYRYFLFSDSHGTPIKQDMLDDLGIYNFSYGSDAYPDMYFKLDFLIREVRPDAIIVTADDHTLSRYRSEMNNAFRSVYYTGYRGFEKIFHKNYIQYLFEKYSYRYLPMSNPSNPAMINKYLFDRIGNKPERKQWVEVKDKVTASEKRKNQQFPENDMSPVLKDALMNILQLCRELNVKVIGIKFPLAEEYIKILNSESYHADTIFRHFNLPVLNYTEVLGNHDEYFLNQDHMNKQGARLFVELLRDDLKDLGLKMEPMD